jgi:hypothetical protein
MTSDVTVEMSTLELELECRWYLAEYLWSVRQLFLEETKR